MQDIALNLPKVAELAYDRLFGHECRRACYRCLKRYGNQYYHRLLDKELVRAILFHLRMEPCISGTPEKAGASVKLAVALKDAISKEYQAHRAGVEGDDGTKSPIERALLDALKRIPELPLPTPQVEVRDGDRLVTIPDFVYMDKLIAIFCDGYEFHGAEDVLILDSKKRNYLGRNGWTVLVFWGRQLMKNPDRCAEEVRRTYEQRNAWKQPSR